MSLSHTQVQSHTPCTLHMGSCACFTGALFIRLGTVGGELDEGMLGIGGWDLAGCSHVNIWPLGRGCATSLWGGLPPHGASLATALCSGAHGRRWTRLLPGHMVWLCMLDGTLGLALQGCIQHLRTRACTWELWHAALFSVRATSLLAMTYVTHSFASPVHRPAQSHQLAHRGSVMVSRNSVPVICCHLSMSHMSMSRGGQ